MDSSGFSMSEISLKEVKIDLKYMYFTQMTSLFTSLVNADIISNV